MKEMSKWKAAWRWRDLLPFTAWQELVEKASDGGKRFSHAESETRWQWNRHNYCESCEVLQLQPREKEPGARGWKLKMTIDNGYSQRMSNRKIIIKKCTYLWLVLFAMILRKRWLCFLISLPSVYADFLSRVIIFKTSSTRRNKNSNVNNTMQSYEHSVHQGAVCDCGGI